MINWSCYQYFLISVCGKITANVINNNNTSSHSRLCIQWPSLSYIASSRRHTADESYDVIDFTGREFNFKHVFWNSDACANTKVLILHILNQELLYPTIRLTLNILNLFIKHQCHSSDWKCLGSRLTCELSHPVLVVMFHIAIIFWNRCSWDGLHFSYMYVHCLHCKLIWCFHISALSYKFVSHWILPFME